MYCRLSAHLLASRLSVDTRLRRAKRNITWKLEVLYLHLFLSLPLSLVCQGTVYVTRRSDHSDSHLNLIAAQTPALAGTWEAVGERSQREKLSTATKHLDSRPVRWAVRWTSACLSAQSQLCALLCACRLCPRPAAWLLCAAHRHPRLGREETTRDGLCRA